ncbi:MAG: acyl-CoA dehydrogenase family protein [Burkholderiaceae bacterium]
MLMDMKARTEAMRALAYFCAGQMDRAVRLRLTRKSANKHWPYRPADPGGQGLVHRQRSITSDGVQVHGGMGYVEETGASQHLRDARITTIYEGTTGIQANDLIGRKLAREGARRALLRAVSTAMRGGCRDAGCRALADRKRVSGFGIEAGGDRLLARRHQTCGSARRAPCPSLATGGHGDRWLASRRAWPKPPLRNSRR